MTEKITGQKSSHQDWAACPQKKEPLVGWDECEEWSKLENVVIEGGGTLDADGEDWYLVWGNKTGNDNNERPMMLDLLWIDGLTIRDMKIRRPGYWTVHPTFSNNVRVVNNSIITTGSNTDGCDPGSLFPLTDFNTNPNRNVEP